MSVDDELPTYARADDDQFIVAVESPENGVRCVYGSVFYHTDRGRWFWGEYTGLEPDWIDPEWQVTHWAPLPSHPLGNEYCDA